VSQTEIRETKEQAIVRGFQAILEHIRKHGITDHIAVIETWIDHVQDHAIRGEMARLLGFYWLRRLDTRKSVHYCDMANRLMPENTETANNAMLALMHAGQWADVIPRGEAAIARFGEMFQWHNHLCMAHGRLGQLPEARRHGTRCLELADAASNTSLPHDLSGVPIPPFDPARPERNVISFSLFGEEERYTRAAIMNARAARFLYLGWSCHFYVDDSVPASVKESLAAEGALVLKVNGMPTNPFGTFWRFLVAENAEVDRYLIRDADAMLNTREFVAVREWLESDRHFHVMRDHYDHTALVIPGMWGGVRGALPSIGLLAKQYIGSRNDLPGRTADQEFLRDKLWPTIRTSVLTHDSQFDFGDRRDFPSIGCLPEDCYVGCDGYRILNLRAAAARQPEREAAA
jgi:hypothetical protein